MKRTTKGRTLPSDDLHFAGNPPNALLMLDERLIEYVRSVLAHEPIPPPDVPAASWQQLLNVLKPHFILPLFGWLLFTSDPVYRPPDAVIQELKGILIWSTRNSLLQEQQIGQVISTLADGGIHPLFLKGYALARSVYPDPTTRTGIDIDFLVPEDQIAETSRLLRQIGYSIPIDAYKDMPYTIHHQVAYSPSNAISQTILEIHWKLDTGFGLMSDEMLHELFSRAVKVRSGAPTFYTLDPIDHLVYSAHHAIFQHCLGIRLSWLYDLYLLADSLSADQWNILIDRAIEWNCLRSVIYGLKMAEDWTPLAIPPVYAEMMQGLAVSQLEERAWNLGSDRNSHLPSLIRLRLMGCPTIRAKGEYLFRFVFPKPRVMRNWHFGKHNFGCLNGTLIAAYLDYWSRGFRYLRPSRRR